MPTYYRSRKGEVEVDQDDDVTTIRIRDIDITMELAALIGHSAGKDKGWQELARLLLDATEQEQPT